MTELPESVIEEAVRLTRLARRAVDENEAEAYRAERDGNLATYGFTARVREEGSRAVLVCYPTEWVQEGTVQFDAIEEQTRAVERTLTGPDHDQPFDEIDTHNRELVQAIRAEGGPAHAENAAAFADFMGNYYMRPVESASAAEIKEFLTEYYPRNVWPTNEQEAIVEDSLRLVFETADRQPPDPLRS